MDLTTKNNADPNSLTRRILLKIVVPRHLYFFGGYLILTVVIKDIRPLLVLEET